MSVSVEDWYKNMPKVSRAMFTAAIVSTVGTSIGLLSVRTLYLSYELAFSKLELWRLVTNLFFFGPFGLNFIFSMFFLVKYSPELEQNAFNGNSADYAWFIILGSFGCLGANYYFKEPFLSGAILSMILYLWSRKNAHMNLSLYGLFTFKAPYFPWVMVLITVMMGGSPVLSLIGIAAAHIYYFLTDVLPATPPHRRIINTPEFLRLMLGTTPNVPGSATVGGFYQAAGGARAQQAPQAPRFGGYNWGTGGQRLGRD